MALLATFPGRFQAAAGMPPPVDPMNAVPGAPPPPAYQPPAGPPPWAPGAAAGPGAGHGPLPGAPPPDQAGGGEPPFGGTPYWAGVMRNYLDMITKPQATPRPAPLDNTQIAAYMLNPAM